MKDLTSITWQKSAILSLFTSIIITLCTVAANSKTDDSSKESSHCGGCSHSRQPTTENLYENEADDYCLANDPLHTYKNTATNRIDRLKNMVKIKAGTFTIGTNDPVFVADGEGPKQQIYLDSFYIDEMEVNNRDFGRFVHATNHRTEAEKFGDSFVFGGLLEEKVRANITHAVAQAPWWLQVKNANWQNPEGPNSNIKSTFTLFYFSDCSKLETKENKIE